MEPIISSESVSGSWLSLARIIPSCRRKHCRLVSMGVSVLPNSSSVNVPVWLHRWCTISQESAPVLGATWILNFVIGQSCSCKKTRATYFQDTTPAKNTRQIHMQSTPQKTVLPLALFGSTNQNRTTDRTSKRASPRPPPTDRSERPASQTTPRKRHLPASSRKEEGQHRPPRPPAKRRDGGGAKVAAHTREREQNKKTGRDRVVPAIAWRPHPVRYASKMEHKRAERETRAIKGALARICPEDGLAVSCPPHALFLVF